MSNENLKKKLALHAIDPGLAQIQQGEEVSQLLNRLIEKVSENKPEGRKATSIKIKGNVIKGEPGKTPVLGVDYFTEEDKKEIIAAATPEKGVDYFTDREVEYIANLAKPEFGVDYFTDREIAVIKRELKPVPGVDFEVPKDGYSPEKGVDYFTTKDKKEIVSELTKKIPQAEKVNYDKIVAETLRHIPAPVFPESVIKEESIDSIIDKLNKKKGVLSVEVLKSLPYDMLHGSKRDVGLTRSAVTGGSTGAVDSVNGQTGIVVLGTADIADSSNKRYVTDAQLTVIGNTSGTNTGDNATNSQYSGLAASKQDTLVSATNIKTVNGTTLLGAGDISTTQTTVSGNAGTATALQTARTIGTATGDVTSAGSSFDGSANNTNAYTLATVNSNVGSFGSATTSPTYTVNGKGLITAAANVTITPAIGSITGLGTGVGAALAVNVGSAGAPVLFNGALGTPSSGTVTNLTGTASININGTVGATTPAAGTFTTVTTSGNIELGNASDTTLARSSAGTMTLEGVRVQTTSPLVVSAASYTTDTGTSLNMDNLDMFVITAQAGALLFNAPGGTLVQGRNLIIRIKDNGTARSLTWNAVFRAMGTALPSTTVLSKTLYLGFKYNSTDTKWDLIASAQEA